MAGQLGFLQADNGQLNDQVKLLKAPVEVVESEDPSAPEVVEAKPRHRRLYYLWLKAA